LPIASTLPELENVVTVYQPPSSFIPTGALGRADLLRALALADGDAGREAALAKLLGFQAEPETNVSGSTGSDDKSEKAQATSGDAQQALKGVFRPYQCRTLEVLAPDEVWQQVQPDTSAAGILSAADMCPWNAAIQPPAPAPLVPWTRLWPRLRQAVARRHTAGIDVQRLTERLANGLPLRRLPLRERLAWPEALPVVLDFSDRLTPYWDDWHRLRGDLERRLHRRVRCYLLGGVPQRPLQKLVSGRAEARWLPWPKLADGDTLLVAGDLGMVDPAHPWPGQCWQNKLDEYRRQGVRVVVLAPVSAKHLQPALVNRAALLRLSPDSALRIAARMPPAQPPPSVQAPSPALQTLLAMLSIATRVEPALLRELRSCLPEGGHDAGLDGEVWCHPELDSAATACALSPWAVQKWRDRFGALPAELQQRTLDCLRNRHACLPQAIHHEETLIWRHLAKIPTAADEEGNAERARHFFVKMKNTLKAEEAASASSEMRALQIQLAGRHVEWAASTLGGQEGYIGELSAAIAQAEPQRLHEALPKGIDPAAWLKAMPPQTPQQVMLLQNSDLSLSLIDAATWRDGRPGTMPLAFLNLDRPAVLWAFANVHEALAFRPWYWQTAESEDAPRLSDLWNASSDQSEALPNFYLHTGRHLWRFEKSVRLPQEVTRGQDRYGLYADLELFGIIQRFRWINPGEFLMGSPFDEPKRLKWEVQHAVTLTQGFWLADSACTQALWTAGMGENPSLFRDDQNNPVENVSWNDTVRFIERLNTEFPDLLARLPTEAEWEYACRAGTKAPFSFGENITPEQVNYNGNYPYANGALGLYREKTVPVKSLPPNAWGLCEMHGNVWEWCADWFGDYAPGPVADPLAPEQGFSCVLRGGSWFDFGGNTRSANRTLESPINRDGNFGFRLALGRIDASGPADQARGTAAGRTAAAELGDKRIHKVLARTGRFGSLRNIENLIREGRVTINGKTAKLGARCVPEDRIEVDGVSVVLPDYAYLPDRLLLYYKAEGELVTRQDPENRPTVFDHLPPLEQDRWVAVGRMGIEAQGLLLFTTNGELADRLNQILNSIECEYAVRVLGEISEEKLLHLIKGVNLEGEVQQIQSIDFAGGDGANRWYRLVLGDGRNGVVRNLLESQGIICNRIIRIRFGNIELPKDMKPHSYTELTSDQPTGLMELAGLSL
jgi:pseudouridine synthase